MKLKLNKKKIKNLSKDTTILPSDMTPQVAGGRAIPETEWCPTQQASCVDECWWTHGANQTCK
ncbi:hypothetical protein [Pseudoalteromonas denitrificans]|uniref:Uncharacterized protein n=1 Tax=Pseudoalteromonas denitrificans DSM 6059 TaxID=1123010 RepID=A0A1I1MZ97_9GAMM|nr:hypothetical protein [Pseudoalteromonas denitrificans]SFC87903.1 hypothetical protein SAMN02745724_02790 [Pseudoalteromonas denitrificans DSM 6059]